jgi:hypothetical protein
MPSSLVHNFQQQLFEALANLVPGQAVSALTGIAT